MYIVRLNILNSFFFVKPDTTSERTEKIVVNLPVSLPTVIKGKKLTDNIGATVDKHLQIFPVC